MPNVGVKRVNGVQVREVESLPFLRSGHESVEIDGFLELVSIALTDYQRRLARSSQDSMTVVQQWPKDHVEQPDTGHNLVLFRVVSRKPWNTTNEGQRRGWKPQQRLEIPHPTEHDSKLTVFGMSYDHEVEFRVSSPHAARANELALLFEKMMLAYAWFLKESGIQQIAYIERKEDITETIGASELYVRPIRYFVRTEEITQETTRNINEILIHYDVGPALKTTVVNDYHGIKDHEVFHPTKTGQTEFD